MKQNLSGRPPALPVSPLKLANSSRI